MITTSGTYLWSFVTQMFQNGQPSHGSDSKTYKDITSTLLLGTPASLYVEVPTLQIYLLGKGSRSTTVLSVISVSFISIVWYMFIVRRFIPKRKQ